MKTHLLNLATVAVLCATGSLGAQTIQVAPGLAAKGIELSEVMISRDEIRWDPEAEPYAGFRLIAKVTNRAERSLVAPVFMLRLDPAPARHVGQGFASSVVLNPGESAVAETGSMSIPEKDLKAATAITLDLEGDPFAHAGWDRQLKFRSSMTFSDTSFRFFPANRMAGVKGTFQNRSGLEIKSVQGTAIFRDAEGRLLNAGPFRYLANQEKGSEMMVGCELPGIEKAASCVLQVDSFEEK